MVTKKTPAKAKKKQPKTKVVAAKKLPAKNPVGRPKKPKVKTKRGKRTSRALRDRVVGRPALEFTEDDIKTAVMLARRGLTMYEIAEVMKVSHVTLRYKMLANPEYLNSVKDAMESYDKRIERALSERALGYTHPEEKIFYDSQIGEVVRVQVMKHYPPDPTSMIFWLKNRNPDAWRDKREVELPVPPGKKITIVYEGDPAIEEEPDGTGGEEA